MRTVPNARGWLAAGARTVSRAVLTWPWCLMLCRSNQRGQALPLKNVYVWSLIVLNGWTLHTAPCIELCILWSGNTRMLSC
eukprot:COSAG06_NODE_34646_length_471_cov_1.489247_1_plen_81_part_00